MADNSLQINECLCFWSVKFGENTVSVWRLFHLMKGEVGDVSFISLVLFYFYTLLPAPIHLPPCKFNHWRKRMFVELFHIHLFLWNCLIGFFIMVLLYQDFSGLIATVSVLHCASTVRAFICYNLPFLHLHLSEELPQLSEEGGSLLPLLLC